ncbi:hypothetical protein APY94_04055 [Thermococcus celericrescens]|uniref:GOLD domain-containing protein n=1 Tax=Thermococcus celericrescens TaxID=227598 RepID=A0A124EBG3_9EURY|nr:hypothetical protein [Thermococcus celericrescens]KUH33911.1 hypothetical protein APY94_04055 [Thermococcus celericrescens]
MSDEIPSLKKVAEPRSLKPPSGIRVSKRRVRTWGVLLAWFMIGLVLFGVGMAYWKDYSPGPSKSYYFTVLPKDMRELQWETSGESYLVINGTVQGGNNDIRVFVVDAGTGQTVKDYGRLIGQFSIEFKPPREGKYIIKFDNSFSTLISKKVAVVAQVYTPDVNWWALEMAFVGIIIAVLMIVLMIIGNAPILTIDDGEAVYEFQPWYWGKLKIRVNGIEVPERVDKHAAFKIGPNDEHTLEIERKFSWTWTWQWIFKVDGREVGRLP